MEYIQDKEFYHVQVAKPKTRPWILGETIFIGDTKNPFFGYYDYFEYPHISPTASPIERENYYKSCLGDYVMFARETIFEEVRLTHFPQLPSRERCLWLITPSDNQNSIFEKWIAELAKNNEPLQILKLKCSGKIHYANSSYLNTFVGGFNKFRELSFKYWSGFDSEPTSPETECLFEGFVTIEQIIKTTTS